MRFFYALVLFLEFGLPATTTTLPPTATNNLVGLICKTLPHLDSCKKLRIREELKELVNPSQDPPNDRRGPARIWTESMCDQYQSLAESVCFDPDKADELGEADWNMCRNYDLDCVGSHYGRPGAHADNFLKESCSEYGTEGRLRCFDREKLEELTITQKRACRYFRVFCVHELSMSRAATNLKEGRREMCDEYSRLYARMCEDNVDDEKVAELCVIYEEFCEEIR